MGIQPLANPAEAAVLNGATPTAPAAAQSADRARDSSRSTKIQEPQETKRPTDQQELQRALQDAVKRANDAVHLLRSNLKFTVDESTGIQVVKFIDVATKEVIRQIPSEEMLALARRLDEVSGLLIKDKA